ncbi:helix-turn-helix domain-containing protein [bacterium]|nr:helix-turn-helix domain-containing protein [bacterium]
MKPVSQHLANSLTELRGKRRITQGQLAKLAGVPRSTIAHMESGEGNPTLSNLARIAAALQVSLEELLTPPRAICTLIKSRDLSRVKRGHGSTLLIRLLPDPIPGMLIDRMEIETGGRMGGVPHVTGTKEYFTCIEGEVTIYVAGKRYCVQEGDVLAFPGDQAHSYTNTGNKKAICLSVVALAPAGGLMEEA